MRWNVLQGLVPLLVWALVPADVHAATLTELDSPTSALVQASDPATGDWRAQVEVRTRESETDIADGSHGNLLERRLSAGVAFSPVHVLTFSAELPVIYRIWQEDGGDSLEDAASGDLDLRTHIVPIRWTVGGVQIHPHLMAGLKLPTGSPLMDAEGGELPVEAQPNLGGPAGLGGAGIYLMAGPWSLLSTASYVVWAADPEWSVPGNVFSGVVVAKRQIGDNFSVRVGAEYADARRLTLRAASVTIYNSGGDVLFATADIDFYTPKLGALTLGASLPVMENLNGDHHEGRIITMGIQRTF